MANNSETRFQHHINKPSLQGPALALKCTFLTMSTSIAPSYFQGRQLKDEQQTLEANSKGLVCSSHADVFFLEPEGLTHYSTNSVIYIEEGG